MGSIKRALVIMLAVVMCLTSIGVGELPVQAAEELASPFKTIEVRQIQKWGANTEGKVSNGVVPYSYENIAGVVRLTLQASLSQSEKSAWGKVLNDSQETAKFSISLQISSGHTAEYSEFSLSNGAAVTSSGTGTSKKVTIANIDRSTFEDVILDGRPIVFYDISPIEAKIAKGESIRFNYTAKIDISTSGVESITTPTVSCTFNRASSESEVTAAGVNGILENYVSTNETIVKELNYSKAYISNLSILHNGNINNKLDDQRLGDKISALAGFGVTEYSVELGDESRNYIKGTETAHYDEESVCTGEYNQCVHEAIVNFPDGYTDASSLSDLTVVLNDKTTSGSLSIKWGSGYSNKVTKNYNVGDSSVTFNMAGTSGWSGAIGSIKLEAAHNIVIDCGVPNIIKSVQIAGEESSGEAGNALLNVTDPGVYYITLSPGEHSIDLWGAQGGGVKAKSDSYYWGGGLGGGSLAKFNVTAPTEYAVYVGGQDGFNGGGTSSSVTMGYGSTNYNITTWKQINSGGGATDIVKTIPVTALSATQYKFRADAAGTYRAAITGSGSLASLTATCTGGTIKLQKYGTRNQAIATITTTAAVDVTITTSGATVTKVSADNLSKRMLVAGGGGGAGLGYFVGSDARTNITNWGSSSDWTGSWVSISGYGFVGVVEGGDRGCYGGAGGGAITTIGGVCPIHAPLSPSLVSAKACTCNVPAGTGILYCEKHGIRFPYLPNGGGAHGDNSGTYLNGIYVFSALRGLGDDVYTWNTGFLAGTGGGTTKNAGNGAAGSTWYGGNAFSGNRVVRYSTLLSLVGNFNGPIYGAYYDWFVSGWDDYGWVNSGPGAGGGGWVGGSAGGYGVQKQDKNVNSGTQSSGGGLWGGGSKYNSNTTYRKLRVLEEAAGGAGGSGYANTSTANGVDVMYDIIGITDATTWQHNIAPRNSCSYCQAQDNLDKQSGKGLDYYTGKTGNGKATISKECVTINVTDSSVGKVHNHSDSEGILKLAICTDPHHIVGGHTSECYIQSGSSTETVGGSVITLGEEFSVSINIASTQSGKTPEIEDLSIKVPFKVTYNGGSYQEGEEIKLQSPKIGTNTYTLKCLENNGEAVKDSENKIEATVKSKDADISWPRAARLMALGIFTGSDGKLKDINTDTKYIETEVVGRIGNLVVEDTSDVRFRELLKEYTPGSSSDVKISRSIGEKEEFNKDGTGAAQKFSVYMTTGVEITLKEQLDAGWSTVVVRGEAGLTKGRLTIVGATEELQDSMLIAGDTTSSEATYYMLAGLNSGIKKLRWEPLSATTLEVGYVSVTYNGYDAVKEFDEARQTGYVTYGKDMYNNSIPGTGTINKWGARDWLGLGTHIAQSIPIGGDVSNLDTASGIKFLGINPGEKVYWSIETIGNYDAGTVEVQTKYYAMNLDTGAVQPLDIYMQDGTGGYWLVNKFNGDTNKGPELSLDWSKEALRRNYYGVEKARTEIVQPSGVDSSKVIKIGNYDKLLLDSKVRTYTGPYGEKSVQRWHAVSELPNDAIFIKADSEAPKEFANQKAESEFNTDALEKIASGVTYVEGFSQNYKNEYVKTKFAVLCSVEVTANGSVFDISYSQGGNNGKVGTTTIPALQSTNEAVVAVYSTYVAIPGKVEGNLEIATSH